MHVTPGYASIALLRDGALIFFRTRQNDATEPVADVVHQTRMFYEDRLNGQGFARVLLVAGPDVPDRDALSRNLGTLFDAPIVPLSLDGIATFGDRVSASEPLVGQIAAPAGIVLRERSAVMLRGNLSTRPFYNERAVQVLLGGLAVVLALLSLFTVWQFVALTRQQRELSARIARDEVARRRAATRGPAGAQPRRRAAARVDGEGHARSQCRHRRTHLLVDGAVQRLRAHDPRARSACGR